MSTPSPTTVTDATRIIREARDEQKMTLRAFGDELGVSHQAVAMWESGEREIDTDRIKDWLTDKRLWVRVMGVRIFTVKFGPALSGATDAPKAA